MTSRLKRTFRRLRQSSRRIQALVVPVFFLTGLMRIMLFLVPFRYLAQTMGTAAEIHAPNLDLSPVQTGYADEIGQAIRAASLHTPWASKCLVQALCAAMLLRLYRIPYQIVFGTLLDANTKDFTAHAWVRSGDVTVCGETDFDTFKVMAVFQWANSP